MKLHFWFLYVLYFLLLYKTFLLLLFFIQVNILFYCATLKASKEFFEYIHLYMTLSGYLFKCSNIIMHSPAIFTRYLLLYPNLYNVLCQFGFRENIIYILSIDTIHLIPWESQEIKEGKKKLLMNLFQSRLWK